MYPYWYKGRTITLVAATHDAYYAHYSLRNELAIPLLCRIIRYSFSVLDHDSMLLPSLRQLNLPAG